MVLVIDCFKLVKGAGKSIGIYNLTRSLIEALGRENLRRGCPETILVLGNEQNRRDMSPEGVRFEKVEGDPLDRRTVLLWELFRAGRKARSCHADRILFPRGFRPLWYRGRDTIIIHDLIPFYYHRQYPGYFGRLENGYIMNRLRASIRGADRVITISDYSREEIERLVPGTSGKITRIYNGLNDIAPWKDAGAQEKVRAGAGDRGGAERECAESAARTNAPEGAGRESAPYIAAVTSPLPHKNASGILRAYQAYYALAADKGETPLSLCVIGIEDAGEYRAQAGLTDEAAAHIRCIRYLADFADMCRVIAGAELFLFLSYAEGFGFPPLEAMQLGTPVICSDRTSLPEVVGDAGILVDPDRTEQVAEAIWRLAGDPALKEALAAKGAANTARFSWESRTREYWQELFDEGSGRA